MKTNAIVRIVLFSLTILILTGLLLAGLGLPIRNSAVAKPKVDVEVITEPDLATSPVSAEVELVAPVNTIDPTGIRKLKIQWVAGDITILEDPDIDQIQFFETANEDSSEYPLHYKVNGTTATFQFTKENWTNFGISFGAEIFKDLVIYIPAGWALEELQLEVASANVTVRNVTIGEVDFDGASGTCDFENCTVGSLDMDTASGDVTFSGSLTSLDFDAASASFRGILDNCPRDIEMDGMSGDLDLTLPQDCGFTLSMDGLSTNFHCERAFSQSRNGIYVSGDGRCTIDVDGMSCNVYIRDNAFGAMATEPTSEAAQPHHDHTDACTNDPSSCPDNAEHHQHSETCESNPESCPDKEGHHPEH